ncbi:MAG: signal peptidase II [Clostridia bacterium]|nr:signal peptidase II [Clostridia bacterium]
MAIYFAVAAAIVILDQLVKYWARAHLMQGSMEVIEGVFRLRYTENTGAAFSILQGQRTLFLIITAVMVVGIVWLLCSGAFKGKIGNLALAMVLGGAVGNFIDRLLRGYVVDMFDFCLINFPVFNVADVFINVGGALLIIYLVFIDKELLREKK